MKVLLSLMLAGLPLAFGFSQTTAFTYQGRLAVNGDAAHGCYDFTFALFSSANEGSNSGAQTNLAICVSNGLFTVTLDLGDGLLAGDDQWLEISARSNGTGGFVVLEPRQKLTATPFAIHALNAGLATLAGNLSPGTLLNPANAANLTNLNATQLIAGTALPALDGRNLTNLLTDTRDFSVNLDKLPYFTRALLYSNQVQVLFLGDSVGDYPGALFPRVMNRYSDRPVQRGGFRGPFPSFYTATAVQIESEYDVWWGGDQVLYQTNAQATIWGGPGGGGFVNANRLQFWYVKSPTNGSLTVEVTTNLTTWLPVLSLDELGGNGIYVTNVALPDNNYAVRITATNRIQYLWPALLQTNSRSTRVSFASSPGRTLREFLGMGTNSIATLLTNLNPDLIIYTQTKDVYTRTNWTAVKYCFDTFAPTADIVLCQPETSGFSDINADTNSGGWYQLLNDRAMCLANGWTFVDCYTPLSDWGEISALKFNSDAIHFNRSGQEYLSTVFWQKVKLIERLHLTGSYVANIPVRTSPPSALEVGANNGRLWINNGTLFYTWSTNGLTVTTANVAGP